MLILSQKYHFPTKHMQNSKRSEKYTFCDLSKFMCDIYTLTKVKAYETIASPNLLYFCVNAYARLVVAEPSFEISESPGIFDHQQVIFLSPTGNAYNLSAISSRCETRKIKEGEKDSTNEEKTIQKDANDRGRLYAVYEGFPRISCSNLKAKQHKTNDDSDVPRCYTYLHDATKLA